MTYIYHVPKMGHHACMDSMFTLHTNRPDTLDPKHTVMRTCTHMMNVVLSLQTSTASTAAAQQGILDRILQDERLQKWSAVSKSLQVQQMPAPRGSHIVGAVCCASIDEPPASLTRFCYCSWC